MSLQPMILALMLTVLSAPVLGQDATAASEPLHPTDLEEKVWVRLVQMQFIATDRNGNPIPDLTIEEMEVKDRGKKMEIAFMKPFVNEVEKVENLPDVRLFVEAPDTWEPATTTKRGEPRHIILFIDLETDPITKRPKAARDTARFVYERLAEGTRVTVFSYNGVVNQECTFTTNRGVIGDAIDSAFARPPRPHLELKVRIRQLIQNFKDCVNDASGAFVASADERCLRDNAIEYADENRPAARDYLAALENVVRFAGGLEGETSVFSVSHGFSVDPTMEIADAMRAMLGNTNQVSQMILYLGFGEGARREMDSLLGLAVKNGVVLTFVDRSLAPSGDFGASQGTPFQPGVRPIQTAFQAAQNDLRELAATTGGVFIETPDVFEGLSEAKDKERGTYVLGYYLTEYRSPKKLSRVKVITKRRGVKINHRRGYYKKPVFDDIVGEIRLGKPTAPSAGFEPVPGAVHLPFALAVEPRNIGYEPTEPPGAMAAQLTLHVRLTTEQGRVLADSYHFLNHGYPQAIWDKGDVAPVTLTGWVEVPPGKFRLVALFTNPKNGRRGELSGEIEIRPQSTAAPVPETPQP
jgi:VWFA-related protein